MHGVDNDLGVPVKSVLKDIICVSDSHLLVRQLLFHMAPRMILKAGRSRYTLRPSVRSWIQCLFFASQSQPQILALAYHETDTRSNVYHYTFFQNDDGTILRYW